MPEVLERHGKVARLRIPVPSAPRGAWTIHVPLADRQEGARRSEEGPPPPEGHGRLAHLENLRR